MAPGESDFTPGQQRARRAVEDAITARGWNVKDLGDAAGLDSGTVGDFLNGSRWPRISTRGKIEQAVGWRPGTIAAVASGEVVGPSDEDAGYVARADRGPALRDASQDELLAELARRLAGESEG